MFRNDCLGTGPYWNGDQRFKIGAMQEALYCSTIYHSNFQNLHEFSTLHINQEQFVPTESTKKEVKFTLKTRDFGKDLKKWDFFSQFLINTESVKQMSRSSEAEYALKPNVWRLECTYFIDIRSIWPE